MLLVLGIIGLLMTVVIVALAIYNHWRDAKRRSLMRLLALGVERSIPLPPLVAAFAEEQWGETRYEAEALATNLSRGISPAQAIFVSPGGLPAGAALAALIGDRVGALGPALRESLENQAFQRPVGRDLGGRLLYLLLLFWWAAAFLTFLFLKIAPAYGRIFDDFGMQLPFITLTMLGLTKWLVYVPLLCLPFALIVFVFVVLNYIGWMPFDIPGTRWLLGGLDSAVIMRALALAAERGQPLTPVLQALADQYPRQQVATRLGRVVDEIAAGREWRASMLQHGLLSPANASLLWSAELVGNLPWALRESADSCERRVMYRADSLIQAISPIVLLAVAATIFLFILAFFQPLVKLINALAQ